ncbi:hypothetical protein BVK86_14310 [Pseudomonas reinekei]|uniref:Uncharacterized protein n=1 Tax=Pseudomonas reinekei TaxID=395598 RepID=A0A1Q9WV39_PSERE|nr:hypothetical protein BVK86_14310 [Pseudomonas reinekei]
MHDVRLLGDIVHTPGVRNVRVSSMKIRYLRKSFALEDRLLKGNTGTSGRKAVQYMETDRSGVTAIKRPASR